MRNVLPADLSIVEQMQAPPCRYTGSTLLAGQVLRELEIKIRYSPLFTPQDLAARLGAPVHEIEAALAHLEAHGWARKVEAWRLGL